MKDCRHPNKSQFKGVAVPDDGKWEGRGVAYRYFNTTKVSEHEFRQEAAEHCRVEQLAELTEHLTTPSGGELSEVIV